MIFTDGTHMVGTKLEELHEFAKLIGLAKCWWHNPRGKFRPHYDIAHHPAYMGRAIHLGAIFANSRRIIEMFQQGVLYTGMPKTIVKLQYQGETIELLKKGKCYKFKFPSDRDIEFPASLYMDWKKPYVWSITMEYQTEELFEKDWKTII